MESPGQLQLAPWDRQPTTRVLSRPHRYCPTGRPAQQRQLGARRVRHVPVRNLPAETYLLTEAGAGAWHDLPRRRATLSRTTLISGLPAMTAPAQAAWIVPPIAAGS